MSDGIWAALSGAVAQQHSLDVVANNVANANTTGFRADRVAFEEVLSQAAEEGPAQSGIRFVQVSNIRFEETQGALRETDNPLDMALEGDGWFVLNTPRGERFTRAGSFVTGSDGVLQNHDGIPVMGVGNNNESVEIRIPEGAAEITVASDGTIHADGETVGQVRVVRFDTTSLQKEGTTLFTSEAPATVVNDDIHIHQGMLEQANVNAVAGMNELITVTRSFEAFQKVIDTFQQLDERTARDLGARR